MKSLLSDNFFSIPDLHFEDENPDKGSAKLTLNPAHEIFRGHFPGNPVVPGVCIVQMIKETLSQHFKKDLIMVRADEIKFLNIIDPNAHPDIELDIKIKHTGDDLVHCSVVITAADKTFMKFRGSFQ
jgi:3-hydroxyacyl-[acyl-carrier-protein] dehydratase